MPSLLISVINVSHEACLDHPGRTRVFFRQYDFDQSFEIDNASHRFHVQMDDADAALYTVGETYKFLLGDLIPKVATFG